MEYDENKRYKSFGRRSGIMLCYPFETKRLDKWEAPYYVQRKLDGARCRCVITDSGDVHLVSSEGNEFIHVPHINEAVRKLGVRSIELDGELYTHGLQFNEIMSIVSRKENIHPNYEMIEYHIFDIVNDFPQEKRLAYIRDLNSSFADLGVQDTLRGVESYAITEFDELMHLFEEFITDGYEGFIVRNKNAPYERKRSTNIMKFKPHQEDIYEIVGYEQERTIHNELKESLGAFTCIGDDGTLFNVGTGPALTREERIDLWKEKEGLIGQYLKVKYQQLTQGRVPRFPVALKVLDLKAHL
jgi:ATP-dependent DNA ligase